jgi:hypothetical protein
MLGLAFQNPEMMFFTSFEENQCSVCLKKTKSFFLMSVNYSLCLDCFSTFFMNRNTNFVIGEVKDYGE